MRTKIGKTFLYS